MDSINSFNPVYRIPPQRGIKEKAEELRTKAKQVMEEFEKLDGTPEDCDKEKGSVCIPFQEGKISGNLKHIKDHDTNIKGWVYDDGKGETFSLDESQEGPGHCPPIYKCKVRHEKVIDTHDGISEVEEMETYWENGGDTTYQEGFKIWEPLKH